MTLNKPTRMIHKQRGTSEGGYTLLELLVVIAISVILLGLLFGPIIQAFNITKRTRAITEAQDAARFGLENITRELQQAAYVFDNTGTPVILPLEDPQGGLPRATRYGFTYPNNNSRPPFLYAKIDFIPAGTLPTGAGQVVDPTTQGALGGADLRFPLAAGTRIVRYFIGLRRNLTIDNRGDFYNNVYEFPRTDDGDYNPFILYRAEFDPTDNKLVRQIRQGNFSVPDFGADPGAVNDPNFFYNTNTATGGGSYAANWRAIASPILSSGNVDLLVWRRDSARQIAAVGLPFRTSVSFAPATIVGDTATPGFLTDTGNEAPGAVPSLYTTKYGQWTLPFNVSFFRFSARGGGARRPEFGTLRLHVYADETTGNIKAEIRDGDATGSLTTNAGDVLLDNNAGGTSDLTARRSFGGSERIFVKTRNVTFIIDPARGRVETGIPPLAGATDGVPEFDATTNEPRQTIFRLNTRDDKLAGSNPAPPDPNVPADPKASFPTNLGIVEASLNSPNYYLATYPPGTVAYPSPFTLFGGINPEDMTGTNLAYGGAMIVPGSERVMGPDNTGSIVPDPNGQRALVTYFRVPVAAGSLGIKQAGSFESPNDPSTGRYVSFVSGLLNYKLSDDLMPNQPTLEFDDLAAGPTGARTNKAQGLPAASVSDPLASQKEIQVTYLWQNNYARNTAGEPINEDGETAAGTSGKVVRPVADVVKVDYATRSLLNITLGVRVYDTSSGQPQLIQVSDRVKINNLGR